MIPERPTDLVAAERAAEAPSGVLVVGTDEWAIEQGVDAIADTGVRVLRCHEPGKPAFPCNGLMADASCPLDAGFDVVVTMRARPLGTPAQAELGVICGLHAGARLIVAGMREGNPFDEWTAGTVSRAGDLATAVALVSRRQSAQTSSTETSSETGRNVR